MTRHDTFLDTVQALELHEMVGEMPAPGCESRWHGQSGEHADHHADGGEHYINIFRPCGCNPPQLGVVRCLSWISYVLSEPEWICEDCNQPIRTKDWIKVLGPVNK